MLHGTKIMPRYHDRNYFFKYVTKEVAKLVIRNHTLRWSCPADFSDPFDHRFAFIDESHVEAMVELLAERIETYIWERDDVQFDERYPFGLMLTHLKKNKNVIPRETFRRNEEMIRQRTIQTGHRALAQEIQGTLLTIFTNIFAASINHDIIVLCHDRRDWMHPERFIM